MTVWPSLVQMPGFPLIQLPRKSEADWTLAPIRSMEEFPLIQLPRKSEAVPGTTCRMVLKFPLIQLPRKSEAGTLLIINALSRFPLIQLPRKSEAWQKRAQRAQRTVSINSTSEEVRSQNAKEQIEHKEEVSINSTSEEVRSQSCLP